MTYDPHKHHRRLIRLKGYDYSQEGFCIEMPRQKNISDDMHEQVITIYKHSDNGYDPDGWRFPALGKLMAPSLLL